jgi:hypothetical protein
MADTGHGGSPAQWQAFADFVRRALQAAADQVEPRADGLKPIRARTRRGLPDRWAAGYRRSRAGRSRRRGEPGAGAGNGARRP